MFPLAWVNPLISPMIPPWAWFKHILKPSMKIIEPNESMGIALFVEVMAAMVLLNFPILNEHKNHLQGPHSIFKSRSSASRTPKKPGIFGRGKWADCFAIKSGQIGILHWPEIREIRGISWAILEWFPYKNHDSRARENSEVVIICPDKMDGWFQLAKCGDATHASSIKRLERWWLPSWVSRFITPKNFDISTINPTSWGPLENLES